MRIGIDGRFYALEAAGLARYTRELIKNLLEIDSKNQYILFLLPKDAKNFDLKAKNLIIYPVSSLHYSLAEQIKLPFELSKIKTDFIHFLNFNHPIFWRGKFIVTINDLTLYFYPGRQKKSALYKLAYKLAMRHAVRKAVKIIAITKHTKDDIVKYFAADPTKIKVIYDAGASENYKPIEKVQELEKTKKQFGLDKPFFLYVGQWREHKNIIRLIEAFNMVRKKYKIDCYLVLTGKEDPAYPKINQTISKLGLEKEIKRPGFVRDEDLPKLYNLARVFVFPSLYEGFGIPPLEAAACGTPVVSSNASCLPEVLGSAVFYVNPQDPSEIASGMVRVFQDEDLRKELIRKGFEQVKKYSWQKMAKETLRLYNEIKD